MEHKHEVGGASNSFMSLPGNVITRVTAACPLRGQINDILWLQLSSRQWTGRLGLHLFTRAWKPTALTSGQSVEEQVRQD